MNTKKIKCLVWDLDNTLWQGTLLEGDNIVLHADVLNIIKTLDSRGILQSIASKNDHNTAIAKLTKLGIIDYFLYPQINWNTKSSSIEVIAHSINISIDSLAFIDDQAFEREEVNHLHPDVHCMDVKELASILEYDIFKPRFITQDSRLRRQMYQSDIQRNTLEADFKGPKESFLASLNMELNIAPAQTADLQRAEELTIRTHQLNTTGYTYSYDELKQFCESDRHQLLVADLSDKYGTYGKIGLILLECTHEIWTVKLLLMSCRVMSRGVGAILINYLRNQAREQKVTLLAEWVGTDRNRMMYMTYKFSHFEETDQPNILKNNLATVVPYPDYLKLNFTSI